LKLVKLTTSFGDLNVTEPWVIDIMNTCSDSIDWPGGKTKLELKILYFCF